ncbi:MAG: DNA-processing protein DprA, partial [Candidatus Thermochlorobacter sp.]
MWRKTSERKVNLILRKDKEFPQELRKIKEPVLGLFILGKLNLNFPLKIAVVGTRKASSIGK